MFISVYCWVKTRLDLNFFFLILDLGLQLYAKSMDISIFCPGLDIGTSGLDPNTGVYTQLYDT